MSDRRDDRCRRRAHRPYELLVGERQQILHAAATARHDDHVHLGQRVQLLDRRDHLRHRMHALHRHIAHLEADGRPAMPGVLQDVPLGGARPAADQADQLRQERQRLLAVRREQPLRRQRLLQLLQPGEEFTDPDRFDLGGPQRQLAARGVPLRFGVHHHPGALADHVGDLVEDLAVARHAHRDVVRRVPQRQKDHARAGPPGELGDLPLDPHRAEPVDPPADEPGHLADRDRRFRGRRDSHTSESNGGH